MKLIKYKIRTQNGVEEYITNSKLLYFYITEKDGNKLGMKKRTIKHNELQNSEIVFNKKRLKMYQENIFAKDQSENKLYSRKI